MTAHRLSRWVLLLTLAFTTCLFLPVSAQAEDAKAPADGAKEEAGNEAKAAAGEPSAVVPKKPYKKLEAQKGFVRPERRSRKSWILVTLGLAFFSIVFVMIILRFGKGADYGD